MASWTTPVTHVAGQSLSISDWNGSANNETFLYQRPYGMFTSASVVSVPGSTFTQIALTTQYSAYGLSVNVGNVSASVAPLGVYQVSAAVTMTPPATTAYNIQCAIYRNGSILLNGSNELTANTVIGATSVVSGLVKFSATTDYISLYVFHLSGSAKDTAIANNQTYLSMSFVGSG
jgi:hypothetical protein